METQPEIFERINQIAILANALRLKIVLTLFNSEFKIGNHKIGSNSHTIEELKNIIEPQEELKYHLDLLVYSNLIENDKKNNELFHITNQCKEVLKQFGVSNKLIEDATKQIN